MVKQLEYPFKSYISPPYDPSTTEPSTVRVAYTFTEEETKLILNAKRKDTPDHITVNQLCALSLFLLFWKCLPGHVVHGALCMLILLDNPPTEADSAKAIWFWGIINLRDRLRKDWRGTYDYPGYCIGVSSMALPVSTALPFPEDKKEHGRLVVDFARLMRAEYNKQKNINHLLAMHARMIDYYVNKLVANMPIPAITPWYAGDGIGETHLSPKYVVGDQTIIEITDFFAGNKKTGPGP